LKDPSKRGIEKTALICEKESHYTYRGSQPERGTRVGCERNESIKSVNPEGRETKTEGKEKDSDDD